MEELAPAPATTQCQKHKLDVEFYCLTCKQLICKKCVTDHCTNNDKCLYLEDYGKQFLLVSFDEILGELNKKKDQINVAPSECKQASIDLLASLKLMKENLKSTLASLSAQIDALDRMKDSAYILPSASEIAQIVSQCKKTLEPELSNSRGIARAVDIIQSTKELLNSLSSNTIALQKTKAQVDKFREEIPFTEFLKSIGQLVEEIKKISSNHVMIYSARVGIPITSNCIYGIKEQGKDLYSYNIDTKVLQQVEIKAEIPNEPVLTQILDKLYFTGGGNYLPLTMEYAESTGEIKQKAPMSVGKKWHGTVVIADNMFVTLGGYNNIYKHLKVCEKYLIDRDAWDDMPPLNEAKQSVAGCLFEGKDLFVFGGYSGVRHDSVEHLRLNVINDEWKLEKFPEGEKIDPFSCGCAAQISVSEILILRGNSTVDAFVYSPTSKYIKKAQPLLKADSFLLQTLYPMKNYLVAMGYYGTVHFFDYKAQSWEEVEYRLA